MRFTRATVPTLKEKPAEADVASHELLLRAGMMRSVAAGVYSLLPLGRAALDRIEDIVRDEMNRAGALEVVLPILHPSEPWMASGRWQAYGPEMMRLKDRKGTDFCLGPTAEEIMTLTVGRTAPSYRDLPLNLYQIQTKFRDEIRPRFGLLRGREFRMKDAYSFHTSDEDRDRTYERMREAYEAVARRCSLETLVVEAPTGLIGGDVSHEFMVISDVGEDLLVYCTECGYGANAEMERHAPGRRFGSAGDEGLEEVHTPGMVSVEEVSDFIGTTPEAMLKCVLYVVSAEPLAVFVPGYREVSESKLERALGTSDLHAMREDEREQFPGITVGFVGPVGLDGIPVLYDLEVKGAKGLVCGANRPDYHLKGVAEGRDFEAARLADVALAVQGDRCAECSGGLLLAPGIEIGQVFKLGTKYTEPLKAYFTDEDGVARPMVMGTYGIGTTRILATVVEQHRDEKGIRWPGAVAPMPVHMIVLSPENEEQSRAAAGLEEGLAAAGIEALVDERDASPGVKFNDADLVGLPVQVVIGKKLADGQVDIKLRHSGERADVPLGSAVQKVQEALDKVV